MLFGGLRHPAFLDEDIKNRYELDDIRLGDLVAIIDADHTFGRIYKHGAVSVGIVVHTNCIIAGHGPGVTTLFTSSTGKIIPGIEKKSEHCQHSQPQKGPGKPLTRLLVVKAASSSAFLQQGSS